MMRWLVGSSLRYRLIILPLAVAAMFFGAAQLRNTPVEVLPEFTPPRVEIQAEALGLSAGEVEQLITAPLEADLLNQVAWIDEIRSESVPGLSSIEMVFEPGTDILDARQMVQERLAQAGDMPNVSKPPVILQPLSSTSRVMMVGLSAKDVSLIEMSVLARWKIKPRLLGVPGVANVAIWGQRERQLQVHVDPVRLAKHGVPLSQVIRTTGNALWVSPLSFLQASTPGSGGFVESPTQRMGIQHVLPITTPQALSRVTIEDSTGKSLRIADVANVVENHQPLIGDALVNDEPGLMLVVETFPGFNTVEVTKGIEDALDALRPGLTGIEMDTTVYRPASYIEEGFDNLALASILGLILLLALLLGVLLDWRLALITVITVPLSMVVAGLVLSVRGAGFNTVALAGFVIALVAVIDDVVIDVDNIRRHLRDSGAESRTATILKASLEMRGPIVYATLIAALLVLPFVLLGGTTGKFLGPLALSYVLALLAGTAVALLVTPALALVLMPRAPARTETPVTRRLAGAHQAILSRMSGRRLVAFLVTGVVLLAGLATLPALLGAKPTLPDLQDRSLVVRWDATPGTSREAMDRITQLAGRELRALPGIKNVAAHVGRAVTSDQVVNINSGQLWVSIDPGADYDATADAVRDVVRGYPGLTSEVRTYPEARVTDTADSDQALVVRVFGQKPDVLQAKADEVRNAIAGVKGVADPRVVQPAVEPTVEVEVDLEAAHKHGIKPGDVRRAAATLLSGVEVGSLFEEQKVFDVVVWGSPETRHSITNIENLLIDTPSGRQVRLGDLAEVRIRPYPVVIQRHSVQRHVDIVADVSGRSLSSVIRDVRSRVEGVQFPVEHHAEILGQSTRAEAATQRTLAVALAALIGIFLLLQAALGSWRLATVLFLTLPVALAGAAVAAALTGGITVLGSLIGFVAVLAIAVRQGLVLLRHYQQLEADGMPLGIELVLRGTRDRLVPVVTTALAGVLVLLPALVLGGAGLELVRPLAVVIIGGLITTTLLTLFLLPVLYLTFAPASEPEPEPASGGEAHV